MKHTPDYIIKNGGVKIPLLFNTWAIKRFCVNNKIEVEELLPTLKTRQIDELLAVAHESYQKYNGEEIKEITDLDTCEWVDHLGGYNGKEMIKLIKIFMLKASGLTEDEFNKRMEIVGEVAEPDKKKGSLNVA